MNKYQFSVFKFLAKIFYCKKLRLLLVVCSFICCNLFAVQAVEKDLRERIYLQTDKSFYLAGEPIQVKLLTTDINKVPLVFSKIAYIELVGDSVAQLQIMVEMINGTGGGQMILPVNIPTGYYRLIAYTQYMRNEGTDVFFEKKIAIVNTFQSEVAKVGANMVANKSESYISCEKEIDIGSLSETESRISLQLDKPIYSTRMNGELIINGLPENIHTLSVSIAGKDPVPVFESNISLFNKNSTKKSNEFSGDFFPEYEGHIISGVLIDNETEKIEVGNNFLSPGIAFPGNGIRFFAGKKNNNGEVKFITSGISGIKELSTVVYHANERYRIDILPPFVTHYTAEQMPSFKLDSAYYSQMLERSVALQVFRYFSDNQLENQNIPESFFKMKPTWSYNLDDYTRFTTMREVFIEFITGARIRRRDGNQEISVLVKSGNYFNYGTMPLVILDGTPISDHNIIYNYDPLTVKTINIYYGPCLQGGYIFDGIVELITYRGQHQNLNLDRSSQIVSYDGPQLLYKLVTPDYSNENNRRSRVPDGRHTLLWEPDIKTNGKTTIKTYFNTSDLLGDYKATVEGITKDGKLFSATSDFKVER